jgi:hypothetical protein
MQWKERFRRLDFFQSPPQVHPGQAWILVFLAGVFWQLTLVGCKEAPFKTRPSDYFTASQEASIKMELVRKTARKPEGNPEPMEVEAYFQEQLKNCQWHFAHEKNGGFYFLISRPAPSLYGKRTGIGGFFSSPDRMAIKGFREHFHMFKMKPEDVVSRGAVLFEKMVNGEDLTPYYHDRKSEKEAWIEFPDDLVYYDSLAQKWMMREVAR